MYSIRNIERNFVDEAETDFLKILALNDKTDTQNFFHQVLYLWKRGKFVRSLLFNTTEIQDTDSHVISGQPTLCRMEKFYKIQYLTEIYFNLMCVHDFRHLSKVIFFLFIYFFFFYMIFF